MTSRNGKQPGTVDLPCQHTPNVAPRPDLFDLSFAAQMAAVFDGQTPDVLLLTHRSALPLAPAIRSFCQRAGVPTPPVLPIFVNRNTVNDYNSRGPDASGLFYRAGLFLRKAMPGGTESVVIIDQYTRTMQTLHVAGLVAQACGAKRITGINGIWYQDAPPKGVDTFDSFMHSVGHAAFEALTAAERGRPPLNNP